MPISIPRFVTSQLRPTKFGWPGAISRIRSAACLATLLLALVLPAHALTDKEEIALGKRMGPRLEAYLGGVLPLKDRLSRRISQIGAGLARHTTRGMPISYSVLDNDDVINAFAGPGGRIYITRRLIHMAESDEEIAAVLAHETGHVDKRHVAQSYESHERAQKQMRKLSHGLLGNMVKSDEGSVLSVATSVFFVLMQQGYSREKESEADAYGARALTRLGYDPRASIRVLQKLAYQKQLEGETPAYLSRHPPMAQRCKDIGALITREHLVEVAGKFRPKANAVRRHRRSRRRR